MLLWFAAVILCLVVCLAALLAVPVDFAFDLESRESFRGRASVGWLYGLVRFPIPTGRAKPKPPKPPKETKRKSRLAKRALRVIGRSAFRRRVFRLMTDSLRALHFRNMRLHVWLGLDDPADTGILCAWIVPVLTILRQHTEADLRLYPDFEDERFEASGSGEIRVVPLNLLAVVLFFGLSPATLRAGWTMVAPARA